MDFAFLRYWNVLEVIATGRVADGLQITGFDGQILKEGPNDATTDRSRPKVYEHLKRIIQGNELSEDFFNASDNSDLWQTTSVWYAFRNAAAHHGGFRRNDRLQMSQGWYATAAQAFEEAEAAWNSALENAFLRSLHTASHAALSVELNRTAFPS